ncbi:MAG: PadR family transcriptional regulator [Acidimicrobiia bacterium]
MAISHALLSLAKEKPRHPYALKQAFEDRFGSWWPLNYGQVHQTLDALVRKGQLERSIDSADPARKLYSVTAAGDAELQRWRESVPEVKIRPLRDDFLLRLQEQGEHPDEPFRALVEAHRLAYSKHLRALADKRSAQDRSPVPSDRVPVERLLLELAIEHVDADARWFDRVRDALDHDIDFAHEAAERIREEEERAHGHGATDADQRHPGAANG